MIINCEYDFNVDDFVDNVIEFYQDDYNEDWKEELTRYLEFSKSQENHPLKNWIQDTVYESCGCSDNLKVDWSSLDWIHESIVHRLNRAIKEK